MNLHEALDRQQAERGLADEADICEEKWRRHRLWTLKRIMVTANDTEYEVDSYRIHLDLSIQFHVVGAPTNLSMHLSTGSWSRR